MYAILSNVTKSGGGGRGGGGQGGGGKRRGQQHLMGFFRATSHGSQQQRASFYKMGKKGTEVGGGVVKGRGYVKAQSRCMMRIKDEALASRINTPPLRGARPTERHRPKEQTVRTGLREGRKKKTELIM